MRPIINMPDMGIIYKKFGKDRACGSRDILTDRQTDTPTDILITILRSRSCGRSKNRNGLKVSVDYSVSFVS